MVKTVPMPKVQARWTVFLYAIFFKRKSVTIGLNRNSPTRYTHQPLQTPAVATSTLYIHQMLLVQLATNTSCRYKHKLSQVQFSTNTSYRYFNSLQTQAVATSTLQSPAVLTSTLYKHKLSLLQLASTFLITN